MLVNNFFSYGLIFRCPFKFALPECPLTEIRKLPTIERIALLENMSTKEMMDIQEQHKKYLEIRKKHYNKEKFC
ncbi:MAG: hypothetical protein JKY16_02550 [Lutibacter sp.]|nr:hypothetical protein [Lutibacter sp.]